ncbi:hypothetical protein PFISCL1PPCAC_23662 [Pristionchus fissidentatus]|uniref:Uncharacterized protein n=1 Tax=Pristionchus fissidentatus TaxID=1538716 RepID=A0AAV5WP39_9BILA|nr:hypothetical protein PFISCL1PPCAC_23662 [Pristionchus fissidentatus]
MSAPDSTELSAGARDRRDSTSSAVTDVSSLDSSLVVNRSAWIPDDEEQAELDRMAAEFEEAENVELSIEVNDAANDSSVEPEDALDVSEARFATPSSVVSSTSGSRTSRLVLAPTSSSRAHKRKSLAERLADDFLTENAPKRRSLENNVDEGEENEENEKPDEFTHPEKATKTLFENDRETSASIDI